MFLYSRYKYEKLGLKTGLSIGYDALGYGVVIPHFGTIVIGGDNSIGPYAVLHTSTCISNNGKIIGSGLYLSTGAKITSKVTLGSGISIGANSVVNKSFEKDNIMIAGVPAEKIKDTQPWYIRDGDIYYSRVKHIENLKSAMGIM